MLTLPPATPALGWEFAQALIECCWSCQSRIVKYQELPTVPTGTHDIGLCLDCEKGLLP